MEPDSAEIKSRCWLDRREWHKIYLNSPALLKWMTSKQQYFLNQLHKIELFLFLSILILNSFFVIQVTAQDSGSLTLEAEQNWDTYGTGGTCIPGTHNIFIQDVDGDGVREIMTGGFSYNYLNGSRMVSEAPFKIWSWNGRNVTLEASKSWVGSIGCLFAADLDADNVVEIVTAGSFRNETGNSTSTIMIWHLNREGALTLQAQYNGVPVASLFASDVDKDGVTELISVGRLRKGSVNVPYLGLWHFSDNALTSQKTFELDAANVTVANSVYASDLENDGKVEIITGGYSDKLNNSRGQLCVWQFDEQKLLLKANENWQLLNNSYAFTIAGGVQGNTMVNNVKAGDLDGDGVKEIVTGGFAWDGAKVNAQLRIWQWNGTVLKLLNSHQWATDYLTELKCLSLSDVDLDGKMDIAGSGITAAESSFNNSESVHDRGQLRVWGWSGSVLFLKQSRDWTFDDGACAWNVAVGDVDNDWVAEIVTVGCTAQGTLCDPDMRIWSVPEAGIFQYNIVYAFAGIGVLAAGSFVALLAIRKIRKARSESKKRKQAVNQNSYCL